ncbi:uncharacterized protein LOC106640550 [Copidosoma floridanum]|uniref:uncharacterized protein LOC106640550 n=1 Tax=Copidosoma floridanum TaxID=29053 RepID=UPI000C6F673E|nr:uncharacterized protein LOC106640550 [Copidosoma floridanum]
MTLKLETQQLNETLGLSEKTRRSLETSLLEMQERFSQVHGTLQSNVNKLEKEHQLLLKSVESTSQLNKRLQTVGLCSHAVYTKKNNEIEELQKKLASREEATLKQHQPVNWNSVVETQMDRKNRSDTKVTELLLFFCQPQFLSLNMLLEQIRMDIERSNEVDQKMEAMLTEFEDVDRKNFLD